MRASAPPSPAAREDPGSNIVRFAYAAALSALAALACSVPATTRVFPAVADTESVARVCFALAAEALGPMLVAVLMVRAARQGLHAFSGPGARLRAWGVALWLALLTMAMSFLGALLRATTHNRALAGVTFGLGALALAIALALVCARIVALLGGLPPGLRRAFGTVLALATVLAVGCLAIRFQATVSRDAASVSARASVVDVLAFVLAGLFAASQPLAPRRRLALVGLPMALLVVGKGAFILHDGAALRAAIDEHAPAFALVARLLQG